jgi:hypothetical protein
LNNHSSFAESLLGIAHWNSENMKLEHPLARNLHLKTLVFE